MKLGIELKLGIFILALFGVLIAGFYFWEPLNVAYYKMKIGSEDKETHIAAVKYLLEADAALLVKYYYENRYASKDVNERLAVVDDLCAAGDKGKELMREIFRARCMREQVLIPAGSFMMGSENGSEDEKPVHEVTLDAFWMDKYEVTNEKYYVFVKITGANKPQSISTLFWGYGVRYKGSNQVEQVEYDYSAGEYPIDSVSWEGASAYCEWLGMRLPNESEWEYACRAGSTTKYCFGDNMVELEEYAWIRSNSEICTHPVGMKQPNKWLLFDMHGNAWEWCQDWYGENYYQVSPGKNPTGPNSGTQRIARGGYVGADAEICCSSTRGCALPYYEYHSSGKGFRVCRSAGK